MLARAAVVPHGDEILAPPNVEMKKLHEAMMKVAKSVEDVDAYVLISPHNIRIDTHIGIVLTEFLSGSWKYGNLRFKRTLRGFRDLALDIYNGARRRGLPVVGVNFGALEGKHSRMPLDWGSLIPLYFLPKRKTVLITPARGISRDALVDFGSLVARIAEERREKIALVVSADHAHTHSINGPYGYSEEAKRYDELVLRALRSGNLDSLLEIEDSLLQKALPDSFWQLLMLLGAAKVVPLKNEFIEYGIADYFGMAVASFVRA